MLIIFSAVFQTQNVTGNHKVHLAPSEILHVRQGLELLLLLQPHVKMEAGSSAL